jgi:formylglycine-generating enzyme required for sulfatase activity
MSDPLRRLAFVAALLLLPWIAAALQTTVTEARTDAGEWDQRYWNPKPMADDVVLPMPCGGRIAFRKVTLRSTGWLDDTRFEVGLNDPAVGWKEDRRFEYIAGAFTGTGESRQRSFLLAKYETTVGQWQALSGACPKPDAQGSLPATNMSWFDAVDFARRYTEWLMAEAPESLPREGEVSGFLRLPTEAEWEFAGRGGLAVDAADFAAPLFPMPSEQVADYVWFQGSQSAGGRLHPVGLLQPNPLGLFDMIGNASEMVLEPFRLNRRGRLHGQAGGFIAKGGDITTPRGQLRTASRTENPYFSVRSNTATALRHLGFRLVVAAPAIVSSQRLTEIETEWARLPTPDPGLATARQEKMALDTLDNVTRATTDRELRDRLQQVSHDLEGAITERNEARERTLRALLRVGAFLGNKLRTDQVRLTSVERAIKDVAEPALEQLRRRAGRLADADRVIAEAEAQVLDMRRQLAAVEEQRAMTLSYYADTVIMVANDYGKSVIDPQLDALDQEFASQRNQFLSKYAHQYATHADQYRRLGTANKEAWLDDLVH